MRTVDDLLEKARRLPPKARRELRDKLDESLSSRGVDSEPEEEGPYAALLDLAGTAHAKDNDVARNKNMHLAHIYASRRIHK
jgi:hypothetical protein